MDLSDVVATAMFTGVVLYGLFGGADFGSGFWDLTAGGARRGGRLRVLIDHSIGPVWEANHVWLIYILVFLWTAYPSAFAAIMTTLFVPMSLALLGIVLRGADFAFRKYSATIAQARLFGALFAGASLITPFFFGTVVGAIASGRVPAEGYGDRVGSWVNPTSFIGGVLAVGTCSFLAGVFLTADAARSGDPALAEYLRPRTLAVGVVTGALAIAAIAPIRRDAPTLGDGLLGRALPLIVVSAAAGVSTLVLVYRRRFGWARVAALVAVAAIVIGWAVAQTPWMLVDEMLIADAAGARSTLVALLVVVALAAVTVLPALAYLFWLTQTDAWSRDETAHTG
ncbi:cytochrome d ubiquinol oxidase subunit II [Nocardia amikacinitolerans]|uniref:cytochrome d ubiquinol oxidase subunit II n=1 Tax=Nocardia amikacinitolerans TaxID=756689 RepID=UPI0020A5DD2B|nr:cytochrome d ubiquinol oxidase subunit II [Nocardia amikacinitolerans]MCP2277880.1 cytochrome bd-I ubiquinol oxidase subunit 2 apoprotein (EC 1.10.3.10) [Nocardia amikacinitolerans]